MKLPNWVLLFAVLFAGLLQYSNQVQANALQKSNGYVGATERNTAFTKDFNDTPNMSTRSTSENITINLNSSNAEQLSSLPGIGIKKANAIVSYRELNGNFESVEELVNVKGIGPKMLAKLQGLISV